MLSSSRWQFDEVVSLHIKIPKKSHRQSSGVWDDAMQRESRVCPTLPRVCGDAELTMWYRSIWPLRRWSEHHAVQPPARADEGEGGTERWGWPRPPREENSTRLQSRWPCKYSFMKSCQITLDAKPRRVGNARERNLGRASQCYSQLTSEHLFSEIGKWNVWKKSLIGF